MSPDGTWQPPTEEEVFWNRWFGDDDFPNGGTREPRRPLVPLGAGGMSLPIPEEE